MPSPACHPPPRWSPVSRPGRCVPAAPEVSQPPERRVEARRPHSGAVGASGDALPHSGPHGVARSGPGWSCSAGSRGAPAARPGRFPGSRPTTRILPPPPGVSPRPPRVGPSGSSLRPAPRARAPRFPPWPASSAAGGRARVCGGGRGSSDSTATRLRVASDGGRSRRRRRFTGAVSWPAVPRFAGRGPGWRRGCSHAALLACHRVQLPSASQRRDLKTLGGRPSVWSRGGWARGESRGLALLTGPPGTPGRGAAQWSPRPREGATWRCQTSRHQTFLVWSLLFLAGPSPPPPAPPSARGRAGRGLPLRRDSPIRRKRLRGGSLGSGGEEDAVAPGICELQDTRGARTLNAPAARVPSERRPGVCRLHRRRRAPPAARPPRAPPAAVREGGWVRGPPSPKVQTRCLCACGAAHPPRRPLPWEGGAAPRSRPPRAPWSRTRAGARSDFVAGGGTCGGAGWSGGDRRPHYTRLCPLLARPLPVWRGGGPSSPHRTPA